MAPSQTPSAPAPSAEVAKEDGVDEALIAEGWIVAGSIMSEKEADAASGTFYICICIGNNPSLHIDT